MWYHKRHLPHYYPPDAILFLTWRLFGSLAHVCLPERASSNPGKAFAETDHLLDTTSAGPLWLKEPALADMVVRALEKGENEYRLYPEVMRWLKGSTARSANLLLERTGKPFWQYETYDQVIRSTDELNRVIRYIERNPVYAGLAPAIEDWPWSSAKGPPLVGDKAVNL